MQYLVSRLIHLVAVLIGVSIAVFLLTSLLPGDPAVMIASAGGDASPEQIAVISAQLGLDKPLPIRYFDWVGAALTGDLGQSYYSHQDVSESIANNGPVTFQLIMMIQVITLVVAVPLAVYTAAHREGVVDRIVAVLSFGAQAIPNFVIALVLILVFAVQLRMLPAIGYTPPSENIWLSFQSLLIPSIAMSVVLIPVYLRVLRSSMIQTLQQEFILVGRGIGLSRRTLLYRYALKPSLPTLITVVGVNIGVLMGGTVVVEAISGIPGLGTLLLNAVNNRDYVLVQGLVLVFAVVYVLVNIIVDLIQVAINPRVRSVT